MSKHAIALTWTQDASDSIKKNDQEDDDNHIMGSTIRPWWQAPLESHWMQTKGSPRCAASLKFHARVYSHNCERSPTLQVESLLFVPWSLAKTPGKSVLADSTELLQDLMWKIKKKRRGMGRSVGKDRGLGVCFRASNIVECFVQNNPKMISFQYM